eukprot:GFYU01002532.1.p1 GENE.GFYU01002532.1~~GFYU01002532.1.p1  ORF type:complete len:856 (-),score=312.55 GFYU01002532.1:62-2629(-)
MMRQLSLVVVAVFIYTVAMTPTVGAQSACQQNINCFNGVCNSSDECECTCTAGVGSWAGDQCLAWTYNSNEDCSADATQLSGDCQQNVNCFHGSCQAGVCECTCYDNTGYWSGDSCTEWTQDSATDCGNTTGGNNCAQGVNCMFGVCNPVTDVCDCDDGFTGVDCNASEPDPIETVLNVVVNVEGDSDVAVNDMLVTVFSVPLTGSTTSIDNAPTTSGLASFTAITAGQTVFAVANGLDGYAATSSSMLEIVEGVNRLVLTVRPVTHSVEVPSYDPSTATNINLPALDIEFPAGAFNVPSGTPLTIDVSPLNPTTDSLSSAPALVAVDSGNERQNLESVYMVDVQIYNRDTGERLQLAPGVSANLDVHLGSVADMAAVGVSAGEVIPMWSFDESAGVWVDENTDGVIEERAGELYLVCQCSHFSWWNCDRPWTDKHCVIAKVCSGGLGANCVPVEGASLHGVGVGWNFGWSPASLSQADGTTCLNFKKGAQVEVHAELAGAVSTTALVDMTGISTPAICPAIYGQRWDEASVGNTNPCEEVEVLLPETGCVNACITDFPTTESAGFTPSFVARTVVTYGGVVTPNSVPLSETDNCVCVTGPVGATVSVSASVSWWDGAVYHTYHAAKQETIVTAEANCAAGDCDDLGDIPLVEITSSSDMLCWKELAHAGPDFAAHSFVEEGVPVHVFLYNIPSTPGFTHPVTQPCVNGNLDPSTWFGGNPVITPFATGTVGANGEICMEVPKALIFSTTSHHQFRMIVGDCTTTTPTYPNGFFHFGFGGITQVSPACEAYFWTQDGLVEKFPELPNATCDDGNDNCYSSLNRAAGICGRVPDPASPSMSGGPPGSPPGTDDTAN